MKNLFSILLVKESRAGEQRVALIPEDIKKLISMGHKVFVESGAGEAAGFSNSEYLKSGGVIRDFNQDLFAGINLIIRAKRPEREREIFENKIMPMGIIMIGALDPFEKNSTHMAEYESKKLQIHSIDQLKLDSDDPMNLLAAMSKMAGKICLQEAVKLINYSPKKVLIIGFGVIGKAALEEVFDQKLEPLVFVSNQNYLNIARSMGAQEKNLFLLDKNLEIKTQQEQILKIIKKAEPDIIITSARSSGQIAPVLIPETSLNQMKSGTVIVDMALSEGGNVEGSHHDQNLILGNNILVTNVSGYPKKFPHEASILWSLASVLFISQLSGERR